MVVFSAGGLRYLVLERVHSSILMNGLCFCNLSKSRSPTSQLFGSLVCETVWCGKPSWKQMTQTINRDTVTRGEYKIKHKLLIYYSALIMCSLEPLSTLMERYFSLNSNWMCPKVKMTSLSPNPSPKSQPQIPKSQILSSYSGCNKYRNTALLLADPLCQVDSERKKMG